jgi:hypothetical protein
MVPLVRFDPDIDMEVPWTSTDPRYCNMEEWFGFKIDCCWSLQLIESI